MAGPNYGFGFAPIKQEGSPIVVDPSHIGTAKPGVETTYVERRVPSYLEDEAHAVIDAWLRIKGYDPESI
jgi:hypothetical protein